MWMLQINNVNDTYGKCEEIKPLSGSVIIFGASGDLTSRKLIPAIFNLFRRNLLPDSFYLIGMARSDFSDETFREKIYASSEKSEKFSEFLKRIFYISGDYSDQTYYLKLKKRISELDKKFKNNSNHIFYFATPPVVYLPIIKMLGHAELTDEKTGFSRVIVEKPFGYDYNSSLELNSELHKYLKESQIYRIDHYLGKETVQNILMLRFANTIFEPLWNYKYIDHVQITVAEKLGVENRAGYFDSTGLLRDMFQNHMLQLLSMITIEPPYSLDANAIRDEKKKLINSIRPFDRNNINSYIVRGQYSDGIIDGKSVLPYNRETGINSDSYTETFVSSKILIDNWRWSGVPFYLRSGKRMNKKLSRIAIVFKKVPHYIFGNELNTEPNVLLLNIQPDEGFEFMVQAKQPGSKLCMNTLNMKFRYNSSDSPDAYERLILDSLIGDQTLFVRDDGMGISWKLFTPVLEDWAHRKQNNLFYYSSGSWGPSESEALIKNDGRTWIN